MPVNLYTQKYGTDLSMYSLVYDNNDTFYLAGYYDPTWRKLKMEKDIPTTANKIKSETNKDDDDDDDDVNANK